MISDQHLYDYKVYLHLGVLVLKSIMLDLSLKYYKKALLGERKANEDSMEIERTKSLIAQLEFLKDTSKEKLLCSNWFDNVS